MNQSQVTREQTPFTSAPERAADRDRTQAREVLDALFSSSEFFRRDLSPTPVAAPSEAAARREAYF